MRIKKVQVKNCLSYIDSGEINIDRNLTILVGKNESGKTNFLKSLEAFNKTYEYSEEDICYHSKAREEVDTQDPELEDIEMVRVCFELEAEEKNKTKELLPEQEDLEIFKRYDDNHYIVSRQIEPDGTATEFFYVPGDIDAEIDEIKRIIKDLITKLDQHTQRHPPFASNKPTYTQIFDVFLAIDFNDVSNDEVFIDLFNKLRNLPNVDSPIQNDIENTIQSLEQISKKLLSFQEEDLMAKIQKILPNFVYFSDKIDLLIDSVKIDEFLANKNNPEYKTFNNLLILAGLDAELLKEKTTTQRRRLTRMASATITGLISESWKQENVEVKIGINGVDLSVYVEDEMGFLSEPSKRSDGFHWYLSFYINFMAGSKGEFKNTVLLLDGPGTYLHPSGQKDLLKTLEKISEDNQVIISTHSPFLIDRNRVDRVRLVSKKPKEGSVIKEKTHVSEFDSLEPIRSAIGMTLDDTLFATKNNLIVEGPSDAFILQAMSHCLKRLEKNYLDFNKISLMQVGGVDKIPYQVRILENENLNYLVLLDSDSKGRQMAKDLVEKYGIDERKIISLSDIDPEKIRIIENAEIEDLVDKQLYNEAVNEAYKEIFDTKNLEIIKVEDLSVSVTKQAKKYEYFFTENDLGGFDKVFVAKEIYNVVSDESLKKEKLQDSTEENFDRLFQLINERIIPSS